MTDLETPLSLEEQIERVELLIWMERNKQLVDNMPMYAGPHPADEFTEKLIRLLANPKQKKLSA